MGLSSMLAEIYTYHVALCNYLIADANQTGLPGMHSVKCNRLCVHLQFLIFCFADYILLPYS